MTHGARILAAASVSAFLVIAPTASAWSQPAAEPPVAATDNPDSEAAAPDGSGPDNAAVDPAEAPAAEGPAAEAPSAEAPPAAAGEGADSAAGTEDGGTAEGADALDSARIADLERLLRTLEDDAERQVFVERLRGLLEASQQFDQAAGPDVADLPMTLLERLRRWAQNLEDVTVDVPAIGTWAVDQVANPFNRRYWTGVGLALLTILGPALVAYIIFRTVQKRFSRPLLSPPSSGEFRRPSRLAAIALVEALPIGAFYAVGVAAFSIFVISSGAGAGDGIQLSDVQAGLAADLLRSITYTLILLVLARAVLAPVSPALRVPRISDERALYLYRWFWRMAVVGLLGFAVVRHLGELRIPVALAGGLERAFGLTLAVLVILFVRQNRPRINAWLLGDGGEAAAAKGVTLRRVLADIWFPVFIIYVAATYLVWALGVPGGLQGLVQGLVGTAVVVALARPAGLWIRGKIERPVELSENFYHKYPVVVRRCWRYQALLRRLAPGLVYLLAAYVVLRLWGVDVWSLVLTEIGETTLGILETLGWVALGLLILWEVIVIAVGNYLERMDDTGKRVERSGRELTLLPLLRTVFLAVATTVVVMVTLSNIGVDIAPLLATAGVVGIAIGFGSQQLVQDVITGLFVLVQDTISVGDIVELGGHAGIVERISVRTIELRDLEGAVHTIPFSSVSTVRNLTKDFSYALMDIGVAYRENVDEVIEVIKQVGAEMEADPEIGQFILDPIEIFGLERFDDSAVIVRVRIKTKVLKQWAVKRNFNLRLKRRFDELGIEIPFPHVTLYVGEDKEGTAATLNLRHLSELPRRGGQSAPGDPAVAEQSHSLRSV